MKADQASVTARITCAQRAFEARQPAHRRVFDDPYARYFVRSGLARSLCASRLSARVVLGAFDRRFAGFHTEIMLRNRVAEDQVALAVEHGVDQIVNLGAGYDTGAFRMDLGSVVLYEVDAPSTQAVKRRVIERHGLVPKHDVVYVPCDFERDTVAACLAAAGFDAARPCVVIWLGVSYFLTQRAACRTLEDVASFSAPGSRLVFDYMDRDVIDGTTPARGALRARRIVARRGEPYVFGLTRDDADRLVARTGYGAVRHERTPQLAARYGGADGVWCRTDDFMGVIACRRTAT
jgi:methyltransferase (TIGR00027 family)